MVVRTGDHAAGTPSHAQFSQIGRSNAPPLFGPGGRFAFYGQIQGNNINGTNNNGIWVSDSNSLDLLAREGDQAPGTPEGAVYFSMSPSWSLNRHGQVTFVSSLRGDEVHQHNDSGIWTGQPGSVRMVARKGKQAPSIANDVSFNSFYYVTSTDSAGRVLFRAQLAGDGINKENDDSIWIGDGDSLTLIAREGSPAPGTPEGLNFGGFDRGAGVGRDLMMNASGKIAFTGFLTDQNGADVLGKGIWTVNHGEVELLIRTGGHAPGTPSGTTLQDISRLSMNALGQVAFIGRLESSSVSNNYGIWAQDQAGVVRRIAQTGDLLEVAPNDFRTITYLGLLQGSGDSQGRPSGFNARGQLAFSASFSDGTQGIFVSNLAMIPEPQSIAMLGIALAVLTQRRSHCRK